MEERCVMCGAVIPEGRQVCPLCETRILEQETTHVSRKTAGRGRAEILRGLRCYKTYEMHGKSRI